MNHEVLGRVSDDMDFKACFAPQLDDCKQNSLCMTGQNLHSMLLKYLSHACHVAADSVLLAELSAALHAVLKSFKFQFSAPEHRRNFAL